MQRQSLSQVQGTAGTGNDESRAGGHQQGGYLRQNATGLVPALKLPNSHTIGESAAIVLHLGEQCSNGQLVPQANDNERPDFLYWLLL